MAFRAGYVSRFAFFSGLQPMAVFCSERVGWLRRKPSFHEFQGRTNKIGNQMGTPHSRFGVHSWETEKHRISGYFPGKAGKGFDD
ncbi:MAG: hypothetical protein K1Y36_14060 [Blastocatellia bacterium]|nr:hypothetical protein [Blastocatellia bacterium]